MFWAYRTPGQVLRRGQRVILAELELIRSELRRAALQSAQILEISMTNQDKINDLSSQLTTAADGLTADIADLKAQVAAGTPAEDLDFSALESKVSALTALDAETSQDVETPAEPFAP